MKRGGPLKRYTRLLPRRRGKPRRGVSKDPGYLSWLHTKPCAARNLHVCSGPIHAHHAGERGLGQKAPDATAIPLCEAAHRSWHDGAPPFSVMTREQRRAWADAQIALHRLEYERPWLGPVAKEGN